MNKSLIEVNKGVNIMIKSYCFEVVQKFKEHDGLNPGALVKLIAPSESEIHEVANCFNISESDITALIEGEFAKIECSRVLAARFDLSNSSYNILITDHLGCIVVCCDKSNEDDEEYIELIHSLWGMLAVPQRLNIKVDTLRSMFKGVNQAYFCSHVKFDDTSDTEMFPPEIMDAVNKSKSIIIVIHGGYDEPEAIHKVTTPLYSTFSSYCDMEMGMIDIEERESHINIIFPNKMA